MTTEGVLHPDNAKTILERIKVKQASYRHAVAWIAENDGAADEEALDVDQVSGLISTCLVADLFGVEPEKVAKAVVHYRKHAQKE